MESSAAEKSKHSYLANQPYYCILVSEETERENRKIKRIAIIFVKLSRSIQK
jgi:hypothetical protein